MDIAALRNRIARRLADLGLSPIEAAQSVKLERSYIRDFLGGKKKSINPSKFKAIAHALEWSEADLLGGNPDIDPGWHPPSEPVVIPEIDTRGGASYGGGIGIEENTADQAGNIASTDAVRANWGIPLPFLRDELHLRAGRVHILPIRGDSMNDDLYDGDRAIIDLDDIDVSQGGIFAILDDNGSVIVKQVEIVRGAGELRRIRCKSRNPNYEPFELILSDPVRIIGRVACKITRL